jgi:putative nucleotidyltransferase with HDIG domain
MDEPPRTAHTPSAAPGELQSFLRSVPELPALSGTLMRAMDMLGKDDIELGHLVDFMSHDQAIVSRLLRVANSPFYGLAGRISTVAQAVNVIGFANTKRLIVALSIMGRFPQGSIGGLGMSWFWQHSVVTAIVSQMLAEKIGLSSDQMFIAGILHDIGRVVMAMQLPKEYAALMAETPSPEGPPPQRERAVFGFDHAQVGAGITTRWNFPEEISALLSAHHGAGKSTDAARVISLADCISGCMRSEADPTAAIAPAALADWSHFGWTEQDWRMTVQQATQRAEAFVNML